MPTSTEPAAESRRPIAARGAAWATAGARSLARAGVSPNAISIASAAAALAGGAALAATRWLPLGFDLALLLIAAAAVGIRSLCNMFDGMVAVEHNKATRSGIVFNEVPDRVSDVAFLAGAGVAASASAGSLGLHLGWAAAAAALFTAYARAFAASNGTGQDFGGPMAKPHRMAVLALACVAAAVERLALGSVLSLAAGLAVIAAGGLLTATLRLARLVRHLEAGAER